jgi:hypothetical protein
VATATTPAPAPALKTIGHLDPLEEYRLVDGNQRHYSGLRFVIFTLFFAITVGLITQSFPSTGVVSQHLRVALPALGLAISVCFLRIEQRLCDYINFYSKRSQELEKLMPGFEQWSARPQAKVWFLKAERATVGIYTVVIGFWVWALIEQGDWF